MQYEKIFLICQNSLEGILTAVYDGWSLGTKGLEVEIVTKEPDYLTFFSTCQKIAPDTEKAQKVARSVRRKLGMEAYEAVCFSAVSNHPQKGTAIFRMLQQAMRGNVYDRNIMENLADPDVNLLSKLRIKVWHEYHRFFGFVRFHEIGGGVLFSQIAPENDILEMLGPHFSDRFPNENWMIYDENRNKVIVHPKGGVWSLHTNVQLSSEQREMLVNKEEYEELWKLFCGSITIEARKNPKLQQQFVPLKFRSNMLEFGSNNTK